MIESTLAQALRRHGCGRHQVRGQLLLHPLGEQRRKRSNRGDVRSVLEPLDRAIHWEAIRRRGRQVRKARRLCETFAAKLPRRA